MHEPDEGAPPVEGGPALFDHAEEPPPVADGGDAPGRPRFGRWR
jgi:hypothetical protein